MLRIGSLLFSLFLVIQTSKFCTREPELTDNQFYDLIEDLHFMNSPFKVIATECPNTRDNSSCLYIIDKFGYNEAGDWFVGRFVTPVPNLNQGFLSVSKLMKPVFKCRSAIDTATWLVDTGIMDPLTPNGVEFATLFTTGHFSPSKSITGNLHFIGVATGGLMSFMAHHFKNLNLVGVDIDPHSEYLAKKWFGYEDMIRSKILIGDGAEFIKKMAERKETSDAVLVDACHNNMPADGIYCPVEAIRTPEFLENLSKVIGKNGITAFNVYSMNHSKNEYENLKESFLKHFEKCRLINAAKMISNVFLICSNGDLQGKQVNRREVSEFLKDLRLEKFMQYLV